MGRFSRPQKPGWPRQPHRAKNRPAGRGYPPGPVDRAPATSDREPFWRGLAVCAAETGSAGYPVGEMRTALETIHRFAARFAPSPFRVKVAVFMIPLLMPIGQNLRQVPAGADDHRAVTPAREAGNPQSKSAASPAGAGRGLSDDGIEPL